MKMFFNVPKTLAHSAGIYKISNSIDDKVYVGRTSDFKHRFYSHKRSFYYLNDKIRIFVYRNPDAEFYFQIIEVTNNIKSAEEFWIKKLKSVENGFNTFHCDEEYFRYRERSIYYREKTLREIEERIKIKAERIALKEKQKEEREQKKKQREIEKLKKKEEPKIGVFVIRGKYILINGKKYDFLGNKIK